MVFKLIFLILFLIGISLFFSTIAVLFLKKKGKRVTQKLEKTPEKRNIEVEVSRVADDYKKRYLDKVSSAEEEIIKKETINNIYSTAISDEKVSARASGINFESLKLILLIFFAVLIVFVGVFFAVKSYNLYISKPKLYFCEKVDFIKLKPIKRANRFTRGNVTVLFKSKSPFQSNRLTIEVYKLGPAGYMPYIKKIIDVKPEWTSLVARILFDELGTYIVEIKDEKNNVLAQKLIEILPDKYGYKPKLKK